MSFCEFPVVCLGFVIEDCLCYCWVDFTTGVDVVFGFGWVWHHLGSQHLGDLVLGESDGFEC